MNCQRFNSFIISRTIEKAFSINKNERMFFLKRIIKLGMVFDENNAPDFGSIEEGRDGALTLLDYDKGKLNTVLTKAGLASYLSAGSRFSIEGGTNAIVADVPAVWRYHSGSDQWYEVIENED